MDKLQTCIGSLRVLTRQEDPNREVLVEKLINEFLREDVDSTLLASLWPAPGSEDTELGVFMGPEVSHGEAKIYARVQA
jgi:hypothetical protein